MPDILVFVSLIIQTDLVLLRAFDLVRLSWLQVVLWVILLYMIQVLIVMGKYDKKVSELKELKELNETLKNLIEDDNTEVHIIKSKGEDKDE